MDSIQFRVIEERLKRIEELLKNIQPKPKKLRQSKIVDERPLEEQVKLFANSYAPLMVYKFLMYWTEGERWKKEKVFDVEKRLKRWDLQQKDWDYERSQKQQLKSVDERPIHREYKEVEEGGFNSIGNLMSKYGQ